MSELTVQLHRLVDQSERPFIKEGSSWYTTKNVKSDIARVQFHLKQAGLEPGDRVLLGLPSSYQFVVLYLATIEYGAAIVSMNPNMPKSEFYSFVERSCPSVAFLNEEHASYVLNEKQKESSLQSIFVQDSIKMDWTWYSTNQSQWLEQRLSTEEVHFQPHTPNEDSIAIILYTSGTTGKPKAVGLTHQQVFASTQNIIQSHKLSSEDIAYGFLPLFHINAQVVTLLSTCMSNGKIILESKFSASKFWNTIIEEKITWVSAVPTIIAILLKIDKPKQVPPHLRFVRSASAKLPIQHAQKFEIEFGIPLIESYGMTEAASQICVNPLPPLKRKAGSVGIPVGLELQVVNEDEQPLNAHETGEIVLRGKNVITEYLQAENQNDFRNGWFHTGDIGYVDEDGYVFIVGRKKELINHGGEKISPYEVEDVITQLPEIDQAAVIGLPDPLYGERVTAFVMANKQQFITIDSLKKIVTDYCHAHLSSYKCPKEVYVVETLPFGPTGKIQRNILKQSYKQFIVSEVTI